MKKKRSIILISILIIVSVTIYFYKPQHNKNNSYQLGVIISIGNKDKSNILYYNDQLQKTGQKKLKIGNIASQYDIPKTVNDKVYMIPKGVPYVNEREEVMELDHNTQKIKLYKIGRPGLFAFDEKDGDIYTTNWINGVSTLTKYNEETGKIQRYEESVGMFGYLHCAGNYVYVEKQVDQEEGTINYLMKIDRKTLKKVKEINVNHSEDESVFFYSEDKNLYFSSGNTDKILYQMDLKKDKISKLKLKEINPQQILPYKNKLFVTHCDLTSGMGKAISLLNPQTGESKVYKFKHNVIQCQTKEDYLYILSNDSIYKYKFDGEKMHLEASSKIAIKGSWKNGYISSFFLR